MLRSRNPLWQLLWPVRLALTPVYWTGLQFHKGLYAWGIKRRYRPPIPVICVGNLTTGGTGKTPLVIAIAQMLQAANKNVAVITRGYRRARSGDRCTVRRDEPPMDPAALANLMGDEPAMMKCRLKGVPVVCATRRADAAQHLAAETACEVIVSDDGFQHWALERDLDIVVIDAGQPVQLNHLMPWGNLREGFRALRRAHVAVITKAGNAIERDRAVSLVRRFNPDIAVWHVDFAPRELKLLCPTGDTAPLSALAGQPVILVAGIASPAGFERMVESLGCRIVGRFFYRDHFSYPELVIRYLERQAEKQGARFLLTTEKDAVKLCGRTAPNAPWAALTIEPVWLDPPADRAAAFIHQKITAPSDGSRPFPPAG
ncbi:MAG: tetraacyldisaccharide 4'-kinase [Candidatus Sumerlaeia bacterium]|nr:tetraacyldisaccharide 4'-kinase [Candidatus Sumerlaeia bacterium]